jgi:hypothetical protein
MAERAVVLKKAPLCEIDTIQIDACREEQHDLSNTVTDHPVEEGFNVTDHSRPDPDVVTLSCFVSNTPLSTDQKTRSVQEGTTKFQTTSTSAVEIGDTRGRGAEVFAQLKKLRDNGTLVKVVTTLRTYGVSSTEGMMITRLSIPRNSRNFDGLEFSISFKQVRIVRNRSTRQSQPKDKRTSPKQKKGNQTTKTSETPDSLLLKGGKYGVFGSDVQTLSNAQ